MLSSCSVREDSWESNQSILKEINTEYSLVGLMLKLKLQYFGHLIGRALTHWKRPWRWQRLKAIGEGDTRRCDGWMVSPTQQTWVWANSRRQWRTGKPGMLQFIASQRVTRLSDWTTKSLILKARMKELGWKVSLLDTKDKTNLKPKWWGDEQNQLCWINSVNYI